MIGQTITGDDGKLLKGYESLSKSTYQPPQEIKELFSRVQMDYQVAWQMQHRAFDQFDGVSLLQRAKTDQETFGAFVGAQYVAEHKKWRWRGRKNTARNKLIGILAHMLAGMLYPLVHAQNEENEADKMTARVMRILVEEFLRKANYETKFLYMVLSALVNPAVFVEVEYVEAYQRIKEQLAGGGVKVEWVIDTLLSGLMLNIVPIDELLLGDFYTNEIQMQPYVIRVKRIPYETARKIYSGRFFEQTKDGNKDLFDYVQPGMTRLISSLQEGHTLFDVEWTEADQTAVQVINIQYRDEDLELDWVGGVGMFNYEDPTNTNPMAHRRLSLIGDEWKSIPLYRYAKSYFEPIDPTGRFAYGKSGAFKEFWDDATQNRMHQLLIDGTYLDVIKPLFVTGVNKVDGIVIAPGAVSGGPTGSSITPWQMGPNLAAAMEAIKKQEQDMSESTQDKVMGGATDPNVTATQTIAAQNQARLMLGVFGVMIADLIRQVGELTMDCIVQNVTTGEIDASVPEALMMKYKTVLAKGKDKGKDVTNRIEFKSSLIARKMTEKQKDEYEWKLWKDGGDDQRVYHVNPYRFARTMYSMFIDPSEILEHALGTDRKHKLLKYQMLSQPYVYPFTDQKAVADEVIEEFSDGDPDKLKAKGNAGNPVNEMMSAVMGGGDKGGGQAAAQGAKVAAPALSANTM